MLIFYTVNRGVMVAVCQIAILVTFALKPTGLWWCVSFPKKPDFTNVEGEYRLPPHLCLSKFHVITLGKYHE